MDADPDHQRPRNGARGDWIFFFAIALLSGLVEINAIFHGGVVGQDFENNYGLSKEVADNLANAFRLQFTNPPLYYLVDGLIIRLAHGASDLIWIGFLNLGLNTAALGVLFYLARLCLASRWALYSFFTLIAFLPVRLLHSIVLAGDALTTLPFFLTAVVLIALQRSKNQRDQRLLAGALAVALTVGLITKFIFLSAVPAAFIFGLQMIRRGDLSLRQARELCAIGLVVPGILGYALTVFHTDFNSTLGLGMKAPANTFTWSDLVTLKPRDRIVLEAPPYNAAPGWDGVAKTDVSNPDGPFELLITSAHSYPALLHLDVFTDTLNLFQTPRGGYFGNRDDRHQRLMSIAVKTAAPITAICIIVGGAFCLFSIARAVFIPSRSVPVIEATTLVSLGWFLNIVLFLPSVTYAYTGGFWTARLIMPALLGLILLAFCGLDRLLRGRAGVALWILIFCCMVLQSVLHVSFLLPGA